MAQLNIDEFINRLPAQEQAAINARAQQITEARSQARKLESESKTAKPKPDAGKPQ